jgi:nitrite reductase/ring-hydroxylating ferredoxin subunit
MSERNVEPPAWLSDAQPEHVAFRLTEQPRWRRDFPIDIPQDEYISRRDFTRFLVLVSLAFATGQVWIVLQNMLRGRRGAPPMREIVPVDEVPIGGSHLFRYPTAKNPAILVRLSEDRFVAYDQQCTHLLCPVIPEPEHDRLHCPCHEGVFDLATGRPIAGPPERPLPRITLEIRDGVIYATGVEERTA